MIDKIMKDIDIDGLFDDTDIEDDYDEVEKISEILFDPDLSKKEKKEAIAFIKEKNISKNISLNSSPFMINEIKERIVLEKQKEYIELGIVPEDDIEYISSEKDELNYNGRYGRSPLHEAIAYRDIKFVKSCIEKRIYLKTKDNNGNTPREMAYYENWSEVVELFDKNV
jgi:ankyrin repeat protein